MPRPHPVKTALAERGETQRQLADGVHVSAGSLSQVLNGHVEAWPALKRRVADYLDRPEGELWPDPVDRLLAERRAQGHGEGFSPETAAAIEAVVTRRGMDAA